MFKKYNTIENTYREKEIEQIYLHGYDKETYVVQEKVHGANFSFITNGKTIQVAKRSGLIVEGENFSNYEHVLDTYSEAIKTLFGLVKIDYPETEIVTIFGELYGGSYEHPDVEKIKGMVRVQKGVFYSPENDFYAFDICINQIKYLDVPIANTYFEAVELFYAKTLFQGTLQKCLDYPNIFQSKIPTWLKLPEIKGNICEGVIIKPRVSKHFRNGQRVIFKNKNEKWSERSHSKNKVAREVKVFSELEKETVNYLLSYVSENRLMNVQSKLGEFSLKQMGKTIGLFAQDALVDFKKDYELQWEVIEKESQKRMTKMLNKEAANMVKQIFLYR